MLRDYQELLEEIGEITTVDGFVSSCLEIKESMFFYERDLMLAAYSASLELLIVVALLNASLQSRREFTKAQAEVVDSVNNLIKELHSFQFPLDIQYVVDHFLQKASLQTHLRLPVYVEMMRLYVSGQEPINDDLDTILTKAHQRLQAGGPDLKPDLEKILGQAGVKMLRGARLRPMWLQISPAPIRLVLLGLQTMMNNFKVTPYFNYPLENITTERQKRKKVKGNVVSDLGVFRNFRQGGSGFTELSLNFEKDQYDWFMESFFSNFDKLEVEPDETVATLIIMVFKARLVNDELDRRFLFRLLAYCDRWQLIEVSDVFLDVLAVFDDEDPLFYEFWTVLKSFDARALPAMRRYARANRDSHLLAYLALFLAHGQPTKRKWSLLKEIFEHYPEEDEGKAQMAISIGRYGGEEAVEYLEQALLSITQKNGIYREGLEKALGHARANA